MKKTFGIFNLIKIIQGIIPNNIRNFSILQVTELAVIFVYCIVIYQYGLKYMSNYYQRLNLALENYANIFTYYCSSNLIANDLLLKQAGI